MVGFTTAPDEIKEIKPFQGVPSADILGSGLKKKVPQKPKRFYRSSTKQAKPAVQPLDASGKEHTLWQQHTDPQLASQSREAAERVLKVIHEEPEKERA